MIQFNEVSKRYDGGNEALAGVSFTVERGEMVFLTGPSGAGKSTLLKLLALIERPSRGQIIINGQNLGGIRRRQVPHYRRQVGVIFQDHKLLHDRPVFDNVALPLI
ncbi:MAG: cell division ATP-binding protein FtsE, partial [Gammaproteobacteria bacterium]